ncbi:hypothetical protein BH10PSE17_BH10PSE17_19340 [soil metagenome]
MERIESFMIQGIALATLVFACFAGYHAAELSYVASLPVVKLERVVITAPATANVAQEEVKPRGEI